MKKLLVLFLAAIICLGMFAACGDDPDTTASTSNTPTLEDAVSFLNSTYKTDEGKKTPADYKLMAQIPLDGVTFTVTWESDLDTIEFVLENGLYTVKVPAKNETEVTYKLTATVKAADGTTATKVFTRVLPVYDNSAAVTEPVEGEAYKMYLVQANVGLTLFATGEVSGKYIKTTLDPTAALDYYVEVVDGGYKFYTTIDGAKKYVHAYTTTGSDDKVSKYIGFADTTDCVYTYKADVKAWLVKINNIEYVVGTYSDYETICISESTYITTENTGVSQFPVAFMAKAAAEALTPDERPADPTDEITISEALTLGAAQESNTYTKEKYIVSGTVTEIKNTTYGNLYIEDADGNKLYVYGLYSADGSTRFDAMTTKPAVGDTITVMGVLGQYNDEPQMKNGWMTKLVSAEGGDETPDTPAVPEGETSITEANTIGAAMEHDTYTTEKYIVSGTVTEIKNTTYGNLYIKDADGNTLYVYGLYSADGTTRFDAMTTQPAVGDTITVMGVLGQYNGNAQMKNGWMTKLVSAEGDDGETPDTPAGAITIAEAITIANGLSENRGTTTENYTIVGVVTEIAAKQITLTQNGQSIICYFGSASNDNFRMGYTLTLTGQIQNYYQTPEFVNFTVDNAVAATYIVSTLVPENGSFTVSKMQGIAWGETVTITATANSGYKVAVIKVNGVAVSNEATATVTVENNISVEVEFVTADTEVIATKSTTYTFSDYAAGTQYATESHTLDDTLTIDTEKCHFTTQLRIYQDQNNQGTAVLKSTKAIHALGFNMGYKVSTLDVYGSNDGVNYVLLGSIDTTVAYADYTLEFDTGYTYVKLDPTGAQIRIQSITVTAEQ